MMSQQPGPQPHFQRLLSLPPRRDFRVPCTSCPYYQTYTPLRYISIEKTVLPNFRQASMGKSSPPAAASPRPRRDASLRLAARAAGLIGLICLAGFSQRLARARPSFFSWKSSGSSSCHFRKASSSYGDFPLPGDAFRFLPCTNATVPPPLDDVDPEGTWRQRFDTDPAHWSWGNQTVSDSTSEEGEDDPYAGRGIFLCGYLDVPLDYTNASDLRIVRLVVTKFRSRGWRPSSSADPALCLGRRRALLV